MPECKCIGSVWAVGPVWEATLKGASGVVVLCDVVNERDMKGLSARLLQDPVVRVRWDLSVHKVHTCTDPMEWKRDHKDCFCHWCGGMYFCICTHL